MSGLVTLAIQACFGASGTIFRLFVAAGADSKTIAGVLLAGTSIIWIRTFFLMPKMWILKTADFQEKIQKYIIIKSNLINAIHIPSPAPLCFDKTKPKDFMGMAYFEHRISEQYLRRV
jgi:hypothetical protein